VGTLLADLPALVTVYGPAALFGLAVLETCFVTGLVVPSGMATAFATVLASAGELTFGTVALAAGSGAFTGDLIGYTIGRLGGERLRRGSGWVARTLRRHDRTTGRFVGRHPIYAVSVARLVAFARTLMPLSSGIARLPLGRFVPFDLLGIGLWLALYMGIGLLAGESWQRAGSVVGAIWLVVFTVAGVLLWIRARKRGELARPPFTELPEPHNDLPATRRPTESAHTANTTHTANTADTADTANTRTPS
jgi:undecaprenyl-diphosphatase